MAYAAFQKTLLPLILKNIRCEHIDRIPARGPFILASNHVSYLEPLLLALFAVRRTNQRVYSLTKWSVWRFFHAIGLAGWLGMIAVPREHRDHVVDHAVDILHRGFPVIIFPEGTRSYEHALLRAKSGVARLALFSGAPVIPVGYLGRPARTTRETVRNYFTYRHEVVFRFGEPMHFSPPNPTHDDFERVTREIMRAIALLTNRPYRF